MGQPQEPGRTIALYDSDLVATGQNSSILAICGTPGQAPRLVGTYSNIDQVPEAHLGNPNTFIADLRTAMHIFHFQPMRVGAQSQ